MLDRSESTRMVYGVSVVHNVGCFCVSCDICAAVC